MKCPTCGFQKPETRLDCEYCGLVFSKWKAKQEAAQKAAEELPEPQKQRLRFLPGPWTPRKRGKQARSILLSRNHHRDPFPTRTGSSNSWVPFTFSNIRKASGIISPGEPLDSDSSLRMPGLLRKIQKLETLFSLFQSFSSADPRAIRDHPYR